jgi:hypothetical protein
MTQSVTSGRILDLLADAVSRYKQDGDRGVAWTFQWMTDEERIAFDLFLVRMKDELAYQPGTCENRFRERVRRMVVLSETGKLANEEQER